MTSMCPVIGHFLVFLCLLSFAAGCDDSGKDNNSESESDEPGDKLGKEPGSKTVTNSDEIIRDQLPDGDIVSCYGGCPLGECDNSSFFDEEPCDDLYPDPVDEHSNLCGDDDNEFCVVVGDDDWDDDYIAVKCEGGEMVGVEICDEMSGCSTVGIGSNATASCD